MENVRAIQSEMRLLPLSAYTAGSDYTPPAGERRDDVNAEPLKAMLVMGPQAYFAAANTLMETNPIKVAIYPKTDTDVGGVQLNGGNIYQVHFDSLPPIMDGGFWSVTAYGSDDFLIANELDRYCINDRSAFTLNADGILDLTLAANAPADIQNWLPTGSEDFHLFMRI